MKVEDLKNVLAIAKRRFLDNDRHLLETDGSERAMTSMLARYIWEQVPDLTVDCEYNRHGSRTKRLKLSRGRQTTYMVPKEAPVMPDIIIHHRGDDDSNLLVVEAKKSSSDEDDEFDKHKLDRYVTELKYRYGLFIKFIVGDEPDIKFDWTKD